MHLSAHHGAPAARMHLSAHHGALPHRCMPQTDLEARAQLAHVWRLDPNCCGTLSGDVAANVRAASLAAEGERHALRRASGSLGAYHEQLQVKIEIRHDSCGLPFDCHLIAI